MSILVSDIVYNAYRISGVLSRAGRGYSPVSDFNDGLWELNSMINLWKSQRTMVYAILRTQFNINANQQNYVIGLAGGADIAIEAPVKIEAAGYIFNDVSPNVEQPFRILTPQLWEATSPKDLTSTISTALYYQPETVAGVTSANGTITLWPISIRPWLGALYTWQTVNEFVNSTDPIIVRPAYRDALTYGLAVRLALRFPEMAQISPEALAIAKEALGIIKSINSPEILMQTERGAREVNSSARGHWSIISNQYI